MSDKSQTTGWIQNLNKRQIIEELKQRGITYSESELYNDLRERLRENIKSAQKTAQVQLESDKSGSRKSEKNVVKPISPEPIESKPTLPTDHHEEEQSGAIVKSERDPEEDSTMAGDSKFQFKLENDDWEIFTEKMECYLITKNITEDKVKVATLVTRLDNDAHALLKQLVAPAKITVKKYEELIKIMTDQLAPTPSEAMERCTFHTAKQDKKETVAEYVARLKKLALHCNFQILDTALRDQIVCGINDKETRVKLFEEKNLTFEKALDIATTREAAVLNAVSSSNVLEKNDSKQPVYAIQVSSQRRQGQRGYTKTNQATVRSGPRQQQQQRQRPADGFSRPRDERGSTCYCCGKPNHRSTECRFRNYNCNYC